MAVHTFISRTHLKIVVIILSALIVVGGIGFATYSLLQRIKPTILTSQSGSSSTSAGYTGDKARQKAEQYVKSNSLKDAKAAYETAAASYAAEKNTTAAADAKAQAAMVEATIKATDAAAQKPAPKTAGTSSK